MSSGRDIVNACVLFGCVVVVVDFALVVSLSSEIALLLNLKVTMS